MEDSGTAPQATAFLRVYRPDSVLWMGVVGEIGFVVLAVLNNWLVSHLWHSFLPRVHSVSSLLSLVAPSLPRSRSHSLTHSTGLCEEREQSRRLQHSSRPHSSQRRFTQNSRTHALMTQELTSNHSHACMPVSQSLTQASVIACSHTPRTQLTLVPFLVHAPTRQIIVDHS